MNEQVSLRFLGAWGSLQDHLTVDASAGRHRAARMVTPLLTVAGDRDLVERQLAGGC